MNEERVFTSKVLDLESSPIERVIESINVNQAITEFIDNAKDSGATEIIIEKFKNERGKEFIQITDNGCGMSEALVKEYLTHYKFHEPKAAITIGLKGSGSKSASYCLADFANLPNNSFETMYLETCDGSPTVINASLKMCKLSQLEDSVVISSKDINEEIGKSYSSFIIPLNIALCMDRLKNFISLSYPNNKTSIILNDSITKQTIQVQCIDRCLSAGIFDDESLWNTEKEACESFEGLHIPTAQGGYFLHLIDIPTQNGIKQIKVMSLCLSNEGARLTNELKGKGGVAHDNGGVFVLRGGRYINFGNNFTSVMGISTNFGGVGRFRVLIDANDDDVANALGVKTNKSESINSIINDYDNLNPNRTKTDGGENRMKDTQATKKALGFFDKLFQTYTNAFCFYKANIKTSVLKPKITIGDIKLEDVVKKHGKVVKTITTTQAKIVMPKMQSSRITEGTFDLVIKALRKQGAIITKKLENKTKLALVGVTVS